MHVSAVVVWVGVVAVVKLVLPLLSCTCREKRAESEITSGNEHAGVGGSGGSGRGGGWVVEATVASKSRTPRKQ